MELEVQDLQNPFLLSPKAGKPPSRSFDAMTRDSSVPALRKVGSFPWGEIQDPGDMLGLNSRQGRPGPQEEGRSPVVGVPPTVPLDCLREAGGEDVEWLSVLSLCGVLSVGNTA